MAKFIYLYPDESLYIDMQILENEKYYIHRERVAGNCYICKNVTFWFNSDFNDYFCSTECFEKFHNQYLEHYRSTIGESEN